MKIIIFGCGKIGKSILSSLSREEHDIAVIDTDETVIANIADAFDVMGICGSGTSCEALARAGVQSAELFIAATGSDEINMLSCFLAKRMGAAHTVARIVKPEYSGEEQEFLKRQLELSMVINPYLLTAQTIHNILKFPSAVRSETFTRRSFEMAELAVKSGSAFDGAVLSSLRSKLGIPFLICCVLRDKTVFIPKGDFTLMAGDKIGLLATPDDMHRVLKTVGILGKNAKNIMIMGGSRVAMYLADAIAKNGHSVKIVEKDPARCNELCAELPRSVNVVCGDGARHELLKEEGLMETDAFVSLTGVDEENILSSFYAFDCKVPRVITKANQEGFTAIGDKLGLDCIISPSRIAADVVTQYARALQNSLGSKIETLYSLMNGSAEALEFLVAPDFRQQNIPLKDLKFKNDTLLAGIIRGNKRLIPGGNDVILPNDRVIVIAANQKLYDLSDIML